MLTAKERPSDAGHWYSRNGEPTYTILGKNGKIRNTTLRDAREFNLVPSVTTILNVAAKPALTKWLQTQVLLAALTLPKINDESEDEYIERILEDSKAQGRAAADAGTDIHASIQGFYEGQGYGRHEPHVIACKEALAGFYGPQEWVAERSFAHELGYGGKVDLHADNIVVDVKTKDFTDPAKVDAYPDNAMQLAAYRVGLGMPNARCANLFVSRSNPGLVKLIEWSEEDLQRHWAMFTCLLRFWELKNDYGSHKAIQPVDLQGKE
jgi:hypothetical protein